MNTYSRIKIPKLLSLVLVCQILAACEREPNVSESVRMPQRLACTFAAGALAGETLGTAIPRGSDIKIDHFIILMQENRSFDHYFGALPAAGHTDVDGFPDDAGNPDAAGNIVKPYHAKRYCVPDLPHDWDAAHRQYNGGRNDGFVIESEPDGRRSMSYMDHSDLPFYYGLAKTYAISDRFFSSVLGPTFPNRFYFLTGTSSGRTSNRYKVYKATSIFDRLDDAGISWGIYSPGVAFATIMGKKWMSMEQFFDDAKNGSLPQVVYIDPKFLDEKATDEHPPNNIQLGQEFTQGIYDALLASPLWPSSALIITYDEHGGFYDHVPPPTACAPDEIKADTGFDGIAGDFSRYGFRVPLIVVSPWSRPGHVSHTTYDLTSVLRLIEVRFNLAALSARDANATPITDLFDFSQPRLLKPPPIPRAVIDPERAKLCRQMNSPG